VCSTDEKGFRCIIPPTMLASRRDSLRKYGRIKPAHRRRTRTSLRQPQPEPCAAKAGSSAAVTAAEATAVRLPVEKNRRSLAIAAQLAHRQCHPVANRERRERRAAAQGRKRRFCEHDVRRHACVGEVDAEE
jgi:hypothetical protein